MEEPGQERGMHRMEKPGQEKGMRRMEEPEQERGMRRMGGREQVMGWSPDSVVFAEKSQHKMGEKDRGREFAVFVERQ